MNSTDEPPARRTRSHYIRVSPTTEVKVSQKTLAPTNTHYFLRPRPPINYRETDDMVDDDEKDEDWPTTDDDVVITISQPRKRTTPSPPLVAGPPNHALPVLPHIVQNFEDLYQVAKQCAEDGCMYKDCQKLPTLFPVLEELHNLVGLTHTKNGLALMIMVELVQPTTSSGYRNIVLTGAPGLGKTTIAKIIAKLLNRLGKGRGFSDEITVGNPLNLISDFEGCTTTETDKVVQAALASSGVLLIDEAPSLNDNRPGSSADKYGKQCLDMLMNLMDQYQHELVIILAGYREEMERNVMQANPGLRRRMQWFFNMDPYTPHELQQIFLLKMQQHGLTLPTQPLMSVTWFTTHYQSFPYYGGSVENLVQKIGTVQIRKTFGQIEQKQVTNETLQEGFDLYLKFVVKPLWREQQAYQREQEELARELDTLMEDIS